MARDRVAIYPGSFDPPTPGHLDIIRRAAALFDGLVVGVLENPAKTPLLDEQTRVRLLEAEIADLKLAAVEVRSFRGLAIDFASSAGAQWIVRGVRSAVDLAEETAMAHTNRVAAGGSLDTVLLPARSELAGVHSRLVRQIVRGGGSLSGLVTPRVEEALKAAR